MEDALMQGYVFQQLVEMTNHLASINAVYLGISVTILGFMAGALYLFNTRPLSEKLAKQEERLLEMEIEVRKNLSSSKTEIRSDLEKFKIENKDEVNSVIGQKHETLLSEVGTKIAVFESTFTKKFDVFASSKDEDLKMIILAELSNQIRNLEKSLNEKIDSQTSKLTSLIKSAQDVADSALKKANRFKVEMLDLQIEYHNRKNQIGELGKMIEKLLAANERGWGVDKVLIDIKNYILKDKMPDVYFTNLTDALKQIKTEEYALLKEEILKLATEKLYKS